MPKQDILKEGKEKKKVWKAGEVTGKITWASTGWYQKGENHVVWMEKKRKAKHPNYKGKILWKMTGSILRKKWFILVGRFRKRKVCHTILSFFRVLYSISPFPIYCGFRIHVDLSGNRKIYIFFFYKVVDLVKKI